jgi:diacylglycerol O-acyltransferase
VFNIPFGEIRAAAKAHGYTVNDVFMASVATGMAHYHDRYGKSAEELRFNLPISLRKTSKDGSSANSVTIARFPLRVSHASIEQRLESAHVQVKRWREEPALTLANPLADASWLVPVPVIAGAAKTSDVTTSNVPGPPVPLYIAGVRCTGIWPLVATIGAAINVTLVTYDGTAFVGISTDDKAVPDSQILLEDLRRGFREVLGGGIGPSDPLAERQAPSSAGSAATKRASAKKAAVKRAPAKRAAVKKAPAKAASADSPVAQDGQSAD